MNVHDENNWGVVETAANYNLIIHLILKNISRRELLEAKRLLTPQLNTAALDLADSCAHGHKMGLDTYRNLKYAIDRIEKAILQNVVAEKQSRINQIADHIVDHLNCD